MITRLEIISFLQRGILRWDYAQLKSSHRFLSHGERPRKAMNVHRSYTNNLSAHENKP